jgi:hypothetical protein
MSINIKNIKNSKKCIKNEISTISENKGILLALIYFINNKYNKLTNKIININLNKYKNILKILFSDLKFSNKSDSFNKPNTFNININTKEIVDLNIIYIDFLDKINANKVYIVPWFDGDNPLIMFSKSNKEQNIKSIRAKIFEWDNCSRTQSYENFNNYDEFIENIILNKYIELNNKWSYKDLINYINKSLSNEVIVQKIIKKKIEIPTPYIVPVPNNYLNKNPNIPKYNLPSPLVNNKTTNNYLNKNPNISNFNIPSSVNNKIPNISNCNISSVNKEQDQIYTNLREIEKNMATVEALGKAFGNTISHTNVAIDFLEK